MRLSTLTSVTLLAAAGTAQTAAISLREFSLELRANWEPVTDTVYQFEKKYALIRDLAPAAQTATYSAEHFRPFLPAGAAKVGDVWAIAVADALPFLRQFHPGATEEMHHDHGTGVAAAGAWACLSELGESFAILTLRLHADFQLTNAKDKSVKSSWFTPAQFRGRMVIDRKRETVVHFELAVPQQSANVDLNVGTEQGVVADIGRIPCMQLIGGESVQQSDAVRLPDAEVDQILARKFYSLANIAWLDLASARAQSLATGKPLHVIALFGSLLDESC